MSYYWLNKKELLEKVEEKYHNYSGKEKAAKYYQDNKDAIKEKAKNKYKNLSEKEKEAKKECNKNKHKEMKKK